MDLVPVKKSTLATWCRDIELSFDQVEAIKDRTGTKRGESVDTQWQRREQIEQIRGKAISEIAHLAADPLWMAGLVLYWGEGGKVRNNFELANSDSRALKLFINWVRRYHDPAAEFALQINLHADNDEAEAKNHWRETLGLPAKPDSTKHSSNRMAQATARTISPTESAGSR